MNVCGCRVYKTFIGLISTEIYTSLVYVKTLRMNRQIEWIELCFYHTTPFVDYDIHLINIDIFSRLPGLQ